MFTIFFTLIYIFNFIKACPLIETNLEFDILGSGFHRQIFISSHLSSKNRLIGCVLSYRFEIPSGAYLNLRSLKHHFNQRNISSTKHCIFSSFDFDVEKPYNLNNESQYSSSTIIFINSNKFPTKSFLLNDYFYLPVRIRYHSPDPKGINLNSDIKFKSPNVFLHCTENNETLLNDINCKRLIQQIPSECGLLTNSKNISAFPLFHKKEGKFKIIQIPVGNQLNLFFVCFVTFCVIIFCTIIIARKTILT
uniref:Phosphatidylinositol-glycan biosynthesis class X protein n=1 Tax=Meloidogyne incognita TaxID=6306 RepID=A0A914LP33_MELIC